MSIYDPHLSDISRSLPAWGVWIEIVWSDKQFDEVASHSPHGECGLKSRCMYALLSELVSLPAWGVWIEIMDPVRHSYNLDGHSPHGECGLKSASVPDQAPGFPSLPAWGVWIEIDQRADCSDPRSWSLPAWGVWIEIRLASWIRYLTWRHSPHGECGLKYRGHQGRNGENRHSPHGECGLKSLLVAAPLYPAVVTPRMGSVD